MQHKGLILNVVFLLGLGLAGTQAQEVILPTGGSASGSGGSASYSIGQVVYTTNTGTNGFIVQGVQQPFEISVVTGLEEAKYILLQCSVYPNPTTDFLNLTVNHDVNRNLLYQLFDINGKLIETKKLEGNKTSIVTSNLKPATYFLKISHENEEVKIFKIIKN